MALPVGTAELIAAAYREDLASVGDITTRAVTASAHISTAHLVARENGCVAGLEVAAECFRHIDEELAIEAQRRDGDLVEAGSVLMTISGRTRSLLTAERVALNFLGWLSGIATATRAYVDAIEGTTAVISDTRKTTPGMRSLERYGVDAGGGRNHRFGLFDAVLIKDNHIAASASISDAVAAARSGVGADVTVEVEVDTISQLKEALFTDADVVLLDNMTIDELTQAVALVDGRMVTEASGGVTLDTVGEIAQTGVDVISVGWITHSAPSLDVAMDIVGGVAPRRAVR